MEREALTASTFQEANIYGLGEEESAAELLR